MIERIAVLGAGTMGFNIARLFAERGYAVSLYEPEGEALDRIARMIRAENMKLDVGGDLEKAVAASDLIVECVPEQLNIKREVYARLALAIKPDALVASNTSTFGLQTLARDVPFADRFVIAHFFNPAHLIPLVEVVGLPDTQPGRIEALVALLRSCGKTPVVLNRDIPGFIANRLQAALMREACHLLESGVADAAQIDTAVRDGLGIRWAFKGPFEIADLGGLDIWSKVTGHLFPELDDRTEAPESLLDKTGRGELGVKTGKGYYDYADPAKTIEEMTERLQRFNAFKQIGKDDRNGH